MAGRRRKLAIAFLHRHSLPPQTKRFGKIQFFFENLENPCYYNNK